MSRIYRRKGGSKTWWGYWRDAKGERHRASLRTDNRDTAWTRLRAREADAPDRAAHGKPLRAALTYLLETVYAGRAEATVSCYAQKARHLWRILGEHTPVTLLQRADVLGYRAVRLTEQAAEGTIYKELVVLRLALKEQGVEGVVPKLSAKYEPRTLHLTKTQADALWLAFNPRRRLWLMLAVYAGLRLGELARLDWADVDLAGGWLQVRGTKTKGANRRVPIAAELAAALAGVSCKAGLVVGAWPNGTRDLKAACRRAKVPECSANDLRRTFASWLKQAGVDSWAVARMMGHASTRMVEKVYAQTNDEMMQRAIEQMPQRAASGGKRKG